MIQTINPYSTARTAEIMSRYRPIAPKPETPSSAADTDSSSSALPNGIRKSPYLSNVWAHLQARPTRTRKRGRTAPFSAASSVKRPRTCLQGLSPPYHLAPAHMHAFPRPLDTAEYVALPLLYCAAAAVPKANAIDLNAAAAEPQPQPQPQDLDLHLHLPEPPASAAVISPRPVRPVGSSIIVESIAEDPRGSSMAKGVEEAVEGEARPAIVSDSSNKVRICNSAYKEMVGQPECCWLDGRRIGGEVSLRFPDAEAGRRAREAAAFTCSVRIEWEGEGKKKMCVNAACSAVKLVCQSQTKDCQFLWRFDTAKSAM
ncbi:uncharacterized protein LOC125196563 [Salvia hispanica]|uniref:uncharacterized protein LOC125196563 n=1 Tax=Salvia hispanica TaxID=49212 RepID=UPI002009333F|nr:uncharacterized protein LOC125196563 [Salvia hispanica]